MPRDKGPKDLPRGERPRDQDEVGHPERQIVEANPGLHFFLQGESKFQHGYLDDAIQSFNIALNMLEHISTPPSHAQLTVKALLRRAQCFFFRGDFDQCIRDCKKACNISKAMGLQEGIFDAIMLKTFALEVTGDIPGAFQLVVFLKTLDLKKAISHVRRLRKNLELIFREDPALADELGDNLMRTGTDFFTNNCFKEATEYFTEVIRLVCEFNFVREAYIYQAKCYVELDQYEEARDLCTIVLERFPKDEDGKLLLESIDTIILERKKCAKGAKKKNSKKPSNSRVAEKQVVPQKKPVLNKKQRQREEYRRKKETEEIGKEIRDKIDKDREKQEQKRVKENKELDGAKSPPMPSYDVKAVDPGARPKERKPNEIPGKTQDRNSGEKKHKDVGCKENGKATSEKGFPKESKPQSRAPDVSRALEGWEHLPDESSESEWGASNRNQTAHTSTKAEHGWTPVASKKQRLKSVAKSSSSPDWPSLPGPSFVEDNSSLQDSNSTATKRFSVSRVELQKLKSERKSTEHSKRGFADDTNYLPQQSHNSSRHLESAGLQSFPSHARSSRQDLFSTDQESFFHPDATYTGLTERTMPVRSSHPSSNSSTESRKVGFGNAPKSQWESLEQISPLQIHHNFDLGSKTKKGVFNTKAESAPYFDTDVSPQTGLNFSWAPPPGVSTLCVHFLQDNKKGQPFRHPKPCPNCTKHSKLLYGIWRRDTKEWQVMRPYPKDVSPNVPFQLCKHFSNGIKCQKIPCTFAHGNEELMFWTSERQSGRAPFGRIADPEVSLKENDFQDIPKPQERVRGSLIIRDIRSTKPRPPPTGVYNGKFQLCKWWKSRRVCRYGTYCTFAHGENELKSWMGYQREIQEAKSEEELTCQKPETSADISLRSEIQMVYSFPGVEISSNKPTTVKISHRGEETRHILHWEFTVKFEIREVGKLCEIDLLHRYHDCYRLTKIMGFFNNVEIFSQVPKERWSYKLPSSSWIDTKEGQVKVVVSISFETTTSNRTFTQCLRFDFGRKPYLLQGLNVDIASDEALNSLTATRQELKLHSSVWTESSVDIIPSPDTTDMSSQDVLLLKEYKLPERIENVISAQIMDGNMTVENYKRVMHQLLFTEELFMKKAISSFVLQNVQLDCQSIANDWSGVVYAGSGELFGILKFQDNESLQPDDAASRLLIRNVNCAWIKMVGSSSQKVYEALVQNVESECVVLKLPSQMCSDLTVSDGGQIFVDVQFQLNRKPLCDWHAAIDRLGPIHLSLLFPTPGAPHITEEERRPWSWLPLDPKLNANQKEVIKRILAPEDTFSPLVVFGPFGTGKTFTLNQAIRHLITKKNNRILLCTHTNSAANLHVKLLHDYLTEENGLKATKPLRIYQTNRRLNADSEVAKMYGLIANNAYVLPTRDDVIRHRVVITSLAMSKHLLELQLNHGFFTHILVDEAAQALEPEALIPLALAGPTTKVVFTGDHMQMSPEVYSHYARDWGLQRSLPERLFDHYCEKMHSDDSLMFLTENYRSHPDILQFPSDNFYGEELIARSEQASHPRFGPLLFFSVHGVEEARENSYINAAEIDEIVKRVKLLADDWPVEWNEKGKEKDLSQIGVISAYMTQVRAIRRQLRKGGLESVAVESIHNVQGKQFRALFISTVRTSLTCHSFDRHQSESQSLYWEFLSDPKLLNTAITRAMSLVAVVGDPVTLCTAGDCRGNWRDYIRRCHEHGTLHGASYEEIKKKIDKPLAKITLNPEANEFVPQTMDVSKELKSFELTSQTEKSDSEVSSSVEKCDLEVDKNEKSSASEIDDRCTIPKETYKSGFETKDTKEDLTQRESTSEEEGKKQTATEFSSDSPKNDFSSVKRSEDMLSQNQGDFASQVEPQSEIQSQEEEDGIEQSASDGFEELPRESFEDETVFPRYLDKIIKALVEKCKVTKEKEAQLYRSSENTAFPSLQAATTSSNTNSKSKTGKRSGKRACQEKSSPFNYSSADYEIRVVKGHQKVRIVNLGFHQTPSDRYQRLTTVSRQEDFLEPQLLQQLLVKDPNKYLPCTLRLNSEIFRTAYAEIPDTKTPDIKIRGRIRGAFDMDHVVVEKTDYQPSSCDGVSRCQGKVAGVLNHIISPHERQYVCKADYENPGVMIPINKSMSKIMNLSDENLNGLPIFREIHDGRERPFEVDVMDFTEALSGKFLFLVQYLHWRPNYQSPTGIVIRKLTQGNTLSDSMKILCAEHGVRDWFSKESKAEVQAKFPPEWLIPVEEYRIRQEIDGAFTIDPANSKDLDDALTLEQLSDSVNRVGVHIADVSYFVEPGTQLDKDAMFRCTSYYPGHDYQSVPMLPRELSENHCSLLPGKDRLCVSVFLDLSEEGQLVGQPEIRRTIARSSCKLTYPEAQKVIDGQDTSLLQIPQDVRGNIRTLSALAQRRRKSRLRDASFDHWSNSDDGLGEDFEAHELVEEMMLLANEEIAKFLSRSQQISDRTPLRTQLPPKDRKLDDWLRQYGQFIKYSLFLRGFYSEERIEDLFRRARFLIKEASISEAPERFKVQESVWSELCHAVETEDQAKLHKLICNESNHPQLAVANSEFRRIRPKSQYVCKSDQPEENVKHFSLGMGCYTQFTSPIRRYIDIQVHRLVLDLISQSTNAKISSKDQVAKVCRRSTFAQDNSRKFKKASNKVHLAAKLKGKSHETTAVIAKIDTDKEFTLEVLEHKYNHLSTRQRKVKLSSLNPFDVKREPVREPALNGLEITWRLRLYIAPEGNSIEEPEKEREKIALLLSEGTARNRKVLNLPKENWLEILKAFHEEDSGKLKTMIRKTESQLASREPESNRAFKQHKSSKDEKADANLEHFYEKKLFLRKFDIVNVQLTSHMIRGVLHPEIQLFKINPSVHICIEHCKYPRECFATTARYQASRKTYASVEKYIDAWEPVLGMEAAATTVKESDEFTIHHLKIEWKKDITGSLEGSFSLQKEYFSSRQIEFHAGDFVCVRVRGDSYMKKTDSENNLASPEKTEGGTNLLNEDHEFSVTSSAAPPSESSCAPESFWVGHCIINHDYTKELSDRDTLKVVTMALHQSASDFPDKLLNGGDHLSTLTVIHRSLPHRRMFAALRSLPKASQLAHSICMGHEPSQEDFGLLPSSNVSIVREHPSCGFKPLNQYQEEAVKEALVKPFTLVQGPPGTGKTVTGVHIAYWFVKRNMQQRQDDLDIVLPDSDDQPKGAPQVIYCGPSNKSVDVVAKYMLKIPDLKIIRVYGDRREQAEFPIPNKRQPLKNSTDDETQILNEDNALKAVSLHHVIRRSPCPFASELEEYERKFDADKMKNRRTSDEEVEEYRELIGKAECWALQRVQIILCTCAASGKPRLTRSCGNIQQCIVDECGMCMELESLVPITCSKARQVVLIGDHKQLQPIIQDNLAMTLGLSVSMFERLSKRAKMLKLQYRMQEEICRFPSKYFYEGKLKTDPSVPTLDPRLQSFWPAGKSGKNVPMAFCHVEGEEERSSIKTARSNEQSKANEKEVRKVVHVATSLVYTYNVDASKVVILSPYREQRSKISKTLKEVYRCKDIPVTTIVKSQGSEWDYVILSLVRSLSEDEIEPKPSLYWLREHLGFLTDEHQMNVGLTRARKGLCIIGNKNLVKVHPMWQDLIESYEKNHCLVNESEWPEAEAEIARPTYARSIQFPEN